MGRTSSAVPEHLARYADGTTELNDGMAADQGPLADALDRFRNSGSEYMPAVPALEQELGSLVHAARAVSERTRAVGRAFEQAGGSRAGSLVSVEDQRIQQQLDGESEPSFGERLRDWLDRWTAWPERVVEFVDNLEKSLGEALRRAFKMTVVVTTQLVDRYRALQATVARLGRVTVAYLRTATVEVFRRTTHWVLEPARWQRRLGGWLARLGRVARPLGNAFKPLAFVLAGWDQWNRDAHRADVSPTERVLRTGLQGGIRGVFALGITAATVAIAGGISLTGVGLLAAPAILAGGIALAALVDAGLDWVLTKVIDDWAKDQIRWVADQVDDLGRWFGDQWGSVTDWASDTWNDLTTWTSDTWDELTTWTSNTWNGVTDWITDTWNDLTTWTTDTWDDLTTWTSGTWESVTDWSGGTWDDLTDWSGDTWDDVTDWTTDTWASVTGWRP
ncbi:MAG TPA: hypothetical protein VM324_16005 [Egibacteraceae bacterium]|jgi:hypothetical protein|nr:hypothetical protein [Egibacteraceae bacterium]